MTTKSRIKDTDHRLGARVEENKGVNFQRLRRRFVVTARAKQRQNKVPAAVHIMVVYKVGGFRFLFVVEKQNNYDVLS